MSEGKKVLFSIYLHVDATVAWFIYLYILDLNFYSTLFTLSFSFLLLPVLCLLFANFFPFFRRKKKRINFNSNKNCWAYFFSLHRNNIIFSSCFEQFSFIITFSLEGWCQRRFILIWYLLKKIIFSFPREFMTSPICFQRSSWYYTIHSSFNFCYSYYLHKWDFPLFCMKFFHNHWFRWLIIFLLPSFCFWLKFLIEKLLCTEMFYSKARHYLFSVVLFNLVLCPCSSRRKTINLKLTFEHEFYCENKMCLKQWTDTLLKVYPMDAQINSFDLWVDGRKGANWRAEWKKREKVGFSRCEHFNYVLWNYLYGCAPTGWKISLK